MAKQPRKMAKIPNHAHIGHSAIKPKKKKWKFKKVSTKVQIAYPIGVLGR